jgi:ABC-type molybdenum transport system ATPase subunit/photorepair protein PhrA
MKLTKIEKIKDYHIFKDFTWDDSIPEFKRYNLIYGWNGSGKTTIANLLRCIEKRLVSFLVDLYPPMLIVGTYRYVYSLFELIYFLS